jgi:hypothetical protein
MANIWLPGVVNKYECFDTIVSAAMNHLRRRYHFKEPDLVVFKSFFWEVYDKPRVEDFRRIVGRVVKRLRHRFTSAFIALKIDPDAYTDADLMADPMDLQHDYHLRRQYTNVIRYWARIFDDVYLFDHAHIFSSLGPAKYLRDNVHIHTFYSNVVLWTFLRFLLTADQVDSETD